MFLACVNLIIAVFTVVVVFSILLQWFSNLKLKQKLMSGLQVSSRSWETNVYYCDYDTIFVSLVGFQMSRQSHGQSILILENREKSKHTIKECTRISYKKLLRIHGKHCNKEL